MERMTLGRLVMTAVAVLALALAGCGGDDGVDQSVHDMVTAERDAAQAATDAAEAAAAAAAADAAATLAAAQMAADTAATEAAAALANAQAALTAAETAKTAAEAARDEARTGEMEAETRASMAEAAATQAAMDAEAAAMTAQMAADALQEALDNLEAARMAQMMAEGDRDDAQIMVDAAMQANMNARGRHITAAIEFLYSDADGDLTDADDDPQYQSPTLQTGATDATITASPNIAEAPAVLGVSLSADGELGVDLMEMAPLQFEEYTMAAAGPPAIDGWMGTTLSRRNNANNAEQIVYAYSDIGAEMEVPFSSVHGTSVSIADAEDLGPAESSSFPTLVTDSAQVFRGDHLAFPGMYDGVPGMFTCSNTTTPADGCTVRVAPSGMRTIELETGATFIFRPTDNQASITVADSDDYLYFGFWLHKPDDPDTAHSFVSLMGSDMPVFMHRNNLISRARYEGPAAGKYVERNPDDGDSTVGIFTADAQLLVDFGAAQVHGAAPGATPLAAEADVGDREDTTVLTPTFIAGTINGSISNFMESGESLGNWRITLGDANLPSSTDGLAGMVTAGTTAVIGATEDAAGQWQGQLYGRRLSDGDPTGVVGRFDVSNDAVTIGGSFGARHTGE